MSFARAEYLTKYLTPDKAPETKCKKRKRKGAQSSTGLVIADDDALGWENNGQGDEEDDGPLTVGQSNEFRRAKKNAWQTVGAPAPSSSDQAAADAIIASAASENAARDAAENDGPVVLADDSGITKMESGAHAGLQTADEVTAALAKRKDEERKGSEADGGKPSGREQETRYRDASGRHVNVQTKRAEARKKLEEEAAKKAAEAEAQKGAVQQAEGLQRRQELRDAKYMPVSRYVDDAKLNEEQKQKVLWNDPANGFLKTKTAGKSITGRPLYTGKPPPPNRYKIWPGHKWDAVDRGNGSERRRFEALARRANHAQLNFAWQEDE